MSISEAESSVSARCRLLSAKFRANWNEDPKFVSSASGRVNLIGEHLDYNGYSVLPMAIDRSVMAAISTSSLSDDPILSIQHADSVELESSASGNKDTQSDTTIHTSDPAFSFSEKKELNFPPRSYRSNEQEWREFGKSHDWTNFVVAAYLGLAEFTINSEIEDVGRIFKEMTTEDENDAEEVANKGKVEWTAALKKLNWPKVRLMIDGDVPMAAGLSSSSALVVAVAFAMNVAFDLKISRIQLAEICAKAERHVGTAGGGMDQAIMCLGRQGAAQLIHFNPLRTESVPLPPTAEIVIAHSLVEAVKALDAPTHFNKRVFECKVAAFLIYRGFKPEGPDLTAVEVSALTLKKVQDLMEVDLEECVRRRVDRYIKPHPYSKEEIEELLGTERLQHLLKGPIGPKVWEQNDTFEPHRRALHVYTEAQRVYDFAAACEDSTLSDVQKLKRLGKLMNASDDSCHALYECGCAELKDLTSAARIAGASGSRLMGAGWGGCTISLVSYGHASSIADALRSEYYEKQSHCQKMKKEKMANILFSAHDADGLHLFNANGEVERYSNEQLDQQP